MKPRRLIVLVETLGLAHIASRTLTAQSLDEPKVGAM